MTDKINEIIKVALDKSHRGRAGIHYISQAVEFEQALTDAGLQIRPIEPTEAMLDAAVLAWEDSETGRDTDTIRADEKDSYIVMNKTWQEEE